MKLENGTRRAQIPRKPLDPPISWIVTQSLIYITSYFLSNSKYVIYFCQDFVSCRRWILSIVNEKPFCNGLIMQMGKIENQQRTNTNVFTLTFFNVNKWNWNPDHAQLCTRSSYDHYLPTHQISSKSDQYFMRNPANKQTIKQTN